MCLKEKKIDTISRPHHCGTVQKSESMKHTNF